MIQQVGGIGLGEQEAPMRGRSRKSICYGYRHYHETWEFENGQ
ncbi:hypothetical protein SAMCCGM7_pC2061 (plasmid) [Sinorhizobium americanum CCGM7]|nr:hypothetical protein [Sinorhizobium americanum]APG89237.1 hypothetical protein SAMCCGM7_pC2061 [Sinorhizobium americanum CCGM7]